VIRIVGRHMKRIVDSCSLTSLKKEKKEIGFKLQPAGLI
jgi:hypothetical protein